VARLEAVLAGARRAGATELEVVVDEERALAAIRRVHDPSLPVRLSAAAGYAPCTFDCDDNPISAGSYRAAVAAVGVCLACVDAVVERRCTRVFAAVRPPGHHALRDRAMGFCFFNNAAIAAEALIEAGLGPVAIADFDVHHGNATQQHFYRRSDVFYVSVHHFPFYPGTGAGDEVGAGAGSGYTRNLPLARGADDEIYCGAFVTGITELLAAVTPAAWVISAGFDAHERDPLGGMRVTDLGFARLGAAIRQASRESPVVAVLEGGYDLKALESSVCAFLRGLAGAVAS